MLNRKQLLLSHNYIVEITQAIKENDSLDVIIDQLEALVEYIDELKKPIDKYKLIQLCVLISRIRFLLVVTHIPGYLYIDNTLSTFDERIRSLL